MLPDHRRHMFAVKQPAMCQMTVLHNLLPVLAQGTDRPAAVLR